MSLHQDEFCQSDQMNGASISLPNDCFRQLSVKIEKKNSQCQGKSSEACKTLVTRGTIIFSHRITRKSTKENNRQYTFRVVLWRIKRAEIPPLNPST
jgi:hypothetical protein